MKIIMIPKNPVSSPITAKTKSVCDSGIKLSYLNSLSPIPVPKNPPFAKDSIELLDCSFNPYIQYKKFLESFPSHYL